MLHRSILASLLVVTGCPDDGGQTGDTSSDDTGSTSSGATLSTATSIGSTTIEPTTDGSSTQSSSEGSCEGACQTDEDCAPGQDCIACECVGEPSGCAEWGAGTFGDCVADTRACGAGDMPICLGNAATGACSFACTEACDCPAPPKGFESQVACEDVTRDMAPECFIGCSGHTDCPADMICFAGTACVFGDLQLPPYGDCGNLLLECVDGNCFVDDTMNPTLSVCAPTCEDVADCPAPESGTAVPTCTAFGTDSFCILDCGPEGSICPDGMVCDDRRGDCVWGFGFGA